MNIFFATTINNKHHLPTYYTMLKVAIKSTLNQCQAKVYLILDGSDTDPDISKEVTIVPHTHRMFKRFQDSPRNVSIDWLNNCRGTYLKTEIPFLANDLGLRDALYLDMDCLVVEDFKLDVSQKSFAACSFDNISNELFCPGVIHYNIQQAIKDDQKILAQIDQEFENNKILDFTTLNNIYKSGDYTQLPIEYNWKPYWGINQKAKIIHFSGAKPLKLELNYRKKEIDFLIQKNPKSFEFYNKIYEELL